MTTPEPIIVARGCKPLIGRAESHATSRLWAGVSCTDREGMNWSNLTITVAREGRMLLGQQNKYPLQITNLSAGQVARAMSQ